MKEAAISAALFGARIALGNRQDRVSTFVEQRAAQRTWWTVEELAAFSNRLAALDPKIQSAFAAKLLQEEPSISPVFAATGP